MLEKTSERPQPRSGDVAKIVTTATRIEDNLRVLRLYEEGPEQP